MHGHVPSSQMGCGKGSTLRSLESMQTCASLNPSRPTKQGLGSKHTPLLQIEPDHRSYADRIALARRVPNLQSFKFGTHVFLYLRKHASISAL